MSINYSLLSTLTSDEVTIVGAVFDGEPGPYREKPKVYHFKTTIKDLAVDDLVVAETAGANASFGLAVVKIVALNVEPDYNTGMTFKWLVSKVDLKGFEELKEAEAKLISSVKTAQKQTKKQQLIAALGITPEGSLRLSAFRGKTINENS
jgi:hypothetical protein